MKKMNTDIKEEKVKTFIESIRPADPAIRSQVDLGYSYNKNNTFELFEVRPIWNNPDKKIESPFAKIRYYKSRDEWNLYWMRANGNWELYDPFPSSPNLDDILQTINEDKHGCFFG